MKETQKVFTTSHKENNMAHIDTNYNPHPVETMTPHLPLSYVSPAIEIITVKVEKGFANSEAGAAPNDWQSGHDNWF